MRGVGWVVLGLAILAACGRPEGGPHRAAGTAPPPVGGQNEAAGTAPPARQGRGGACEAFSGVPPEPAPASADADGRHAAFLIRADADAGTLTYDVIQFLGGEEAKRAYQRETGEADSPPNDYYIVNESRRLRTLPVARGACLAVFETGDPASSRAVDLRGLEAFLEARTGTDWPPFWVTRRGGMITAVQQQWVP